MCSLLMLSRTFSILKPQFTINCCSKMPVFAQRLNPILGENTWECQDEDYDYQQEIARSSFADMLHDTERNQKYFDALKLAIEKVHAMGKKVKVLDIGTGTGLLSMMAVRCGADSVTACEAFTAMSSCAKKVTALNDCAGKIKIVSKHSTELTVGENGDLPERANILVTEVFDTELIGEGALATFSHAHKELLEPGSIVVPNSATVYAQVVETPLAETWNRFKDVCDEEEIVVQSLDSIRRCRGAAAVHDIQLSQLPQDCFEEIIPPTPVFEFDWSGKTPLVFNRRGVAKVCAERSGKAQVVFMWWELGMDTENKIILSCAPYWAHPLKKTDPGVKSADIPWRDHWMQALYYLPKETNVTKGEQLQLVSCHDQYSWWFNLRNVPIVEENFSKPVCECDFHIAHSRTRIGQINDHIRNKKYLSVLKRCINKDSVVLLIGDGFYAGLAAAKLGAKKLYYLGDNYLSTRLFKQFVDFNKIPNVEIVDNVEKQKENIKDVTLVLGQPHFSTTILPWDGLHFAYLIKKLRDVLSPNVVVAPRTASIKGVVVEFKDLQKVRLPVEAYAEFDLKPFDDLIKSSVMRCDANVEAQPLWEYPCIARSPVEEIIKLDLETMFRTKNIDVRTSFKLNGKSNYNAVTLWVDWDLDESGENIISTGPVAPPLVGEPIKWDMHIRQGVHFLCKKERPELQAQLNFNVEDGSIKFLVC